MKLVYSLLYWLSKINWYYILVLLIIPLGEVHQFFKNPNKDVDVFLLKTWKLNLEWVIIDVSHKLQFIIVAFIAYKRPPINKAVLLAILLFGLLDLVFYFLTFSLGWYSLVYYAIAMILIIRKSDKGFQVFLK